MNIQRVAGAAHILHDGKVLLAKRAKDDFLGGHWELVGGSLEWGEFPTDGLLREVKEESGLDVEIIHPYYVHHYFHEKEGVQIVEIAYLCRVAGDPSVVLSEEHEAYQWVTEDELLHVMPVSDKMRKVIEEGFRFWGELQRK